MLLALLLAAAAPQLAPLARPPLARPPLGPASGPASDPAPIAGLSRTAQGRLALLATHPASPLAAPETGPEFEVVELTTSDRIVLRAAFYPSKVKGQRAPAVLLVHDAGADRTQLAPLAERLQKLGFAVLAPDLRGHGKSVGPDYDWSKLDAAGRERLWAFATRDLESAARWLRDNPTVHATNLNLVGVRAGCTLVVRHALRDENVRSLGLIAPQARELGFDLEGDIQELAGLPVFLISSRDGRDRSETIVVNAHAAAGGRAFIELSVARCKGDDVLDDKKLPNNLSKWLKDKAFPSRGRD